MQDLQVPLFRAGLHTEQNDHADHHRQTHRDGDTITTPAIVN